MFIIFTLKEYTKMKMETGKSLGVHKLLPNKACTGSLLSFGHLPLKGKTQHWEYSGFEIFLLSSRVYGPLR